MSLLTCELINNPELVRIAEQAYAEILAEAKTRVNAEKKRLLATRNRFDAKGAEALYARISAEMIQARIRELTEVRTRLRRAEKVIQQLRAELRAHRSGDAPHG